MIDKPRLSSLVMAAKQLPKTPGVYLMKDKNGKVIYVGKSKSLHHRVLQYFTAPDRHPPKTARLVENIHDFSCIYTHTELESLVLENEMIKLYPPRFNIRLKDDKGYAYLKFDAKEPYPRLVMVRNRSKDPKDAARYFGPFTSTRTVYELIHTVSKIFRLPTCHSVFPRDIGKNRPCLQYHMGQCLGICKGDITPQFYQEQTKNALLFLQKGYKGVFRALKTEMQIASDALEFEKAARLRDTLVALQKLGDKQKIVTGRKEPTDVFGYAADDALTVLSVLMLREGRVVDSACYYFGADEIVDHDAFSSFMISFYSTRQIPKSILLPPVLQLDSEGSEGLWLSEKAGYKVTVKTPQRGEARKMVELANENALRAKTVRNARNRQSEEVLEELAQLLSLEVVPERIEAYDISNSGADHWSAGMIVVEKGAFHKKNYRSFTIRTDEKSDLAAMEEVLSRRFTHLDDPSFPLLPDLILLDGGIAQLAAAAKALAEAGLSIPCFGMVKDEHHKTRTLLSFDGEIAIANQQRIFTFIYKIQEEVHRYALKQMDTKRRAGQLDSSLEKIRGIGKAKAKSLLQHFRTLAAIQAAGIEELSAVKGLSITDAKAIFDTFHPHE